MKFFLRPTPHPIRAKYALYTSHNSLLFTRPPWWTPARLLIVIGVLAFIAFAVLVWNILLKKVSDRKGRDLAAARFANSESELKVRDRTRLALALESGAAGAITKTAEDAELVTVIRNIADGGKYISPEIEKLLTESPPIPKLTPRQHEILAYMTKGLTNVEIAEILRIRKDTVEEHVNLLLAKLDAANRTEAVAIAMRKQLIKP